MAPKTRTRDRTMTSQRLETVIAFRHGRFPLNNRAGLVGLSALEAVARGIPSNADMTFDLLPEGREQAVRLRGVLADFAIDACLASPSLRTQTTADIALADHHVPIVSVTDSLRERSRGAFSYAPDEWAQRQLVYRLGKQSVQHWQPFGLDYNNRPGESIAEVAATRAPEALADAERLAPSHTVAFSTHGEFMLALRALLLDLSDEQCRAPIVEKPKGIRALQSAKWIGHGQIDIFRGVELTPEGWRAEQFRAIGTEPGSEFDTSNYTLAV